MFVPYIQPVEYPAFGLTDANAPLVNHACRIVNNKLRRPEGLLWSPDANGAPAYMTNLNPSLSVQSAGSINHGQNVVITVAGTTFGIQNIGDVVILDRATSNLTEACIVTATSGNTLTLGSVQCSHAAHTSVDFGLTLLAEVPIPNKRTTVRVSRTPVASLLSGFGRYGYGRRSQQFAGPDINTNLLAYVGAFGGPPMWTQFPVSETDINMNTGEIWIPPGLLLAYFSDVRLRYVAGWSLANLPYDIKQAVANIVRNRIDSGIPSNFKIAKSGDAMLEQWSASAIDKDTESLLKPYEALLMS